MLVRIITRPMPPFMAAAPYTMHDVYVRASEGEDEKGFRVTLQVEDRKGWENDGREGAEAVVKSVIEFLLSHKSADELPGNFDCDIVKNFEGWNDLLVVA